MSGEEQLNEKDFYVRWLRSGALAVVAIAAIVFGMSAPVQAAPSLNRTAYIPGGGGFAEFDADVAGQPGVERLRVCDTKADGKGVEGHLDWSSSGFIDLKDPSSNGICSTYTGNFRGEERYIYLTVCWYRGSDWECSPSLTAYA